MIEVRELGWNYDIYRNKSEVSEICLGVLQLF